MILAPAAAARKAKGAAAFEGAGWRGSAMGGTAPREPSRRDRCMGPRGGPLPTMHPPMPTIDAWLDDAMQSLSAAAKRPIGAAPSHTRGAKERTAGGQLAAMEKRMRSALSDLAAAPGGDSIARLIEQRVEQLGNHPQILADSFGQHSKARRARRRRSRVSGFSVTPFEFFARAAVARFVWSGFWPASHCRNFLDRPRPGRRSGHHPFFTLFFRDQLDEPRQLGRVERDRRLEIVFLVGGRRRISRAWAATIIV